MKTLGSLMLLAILVWGCSKSTSPAATEAAFSKYEDSEGKSVFREKCGKCHRYKLPETHTASSWPGIVDKMARKAKLSDDQKAAVLAFVTKHAKAS